MSPSSSPSSSIPQPFPPRRITSAPTPALHEMLELYDLYQASDPDTRANVRDYMKFRQRLAHPPH